MADHSRKYPAARARAAEAHSLRAIGYSWSEIRDELHYGSTGAARSAVLRHVERETEPVTLTRAGIVETLRLASRGLWQRYAAAIERGDDSAAVALTREIRSNSDVLAKLSASYAPAQAAVRVQNTVSVDRSALLAALDGRQHPAPALLDAEVLDAEVLDEREDAHR